MAMRMANFKSVKVLGLINFWQGGEMEWINNHLFDPHLSDDSRLVKRAW